MKIINLEQGSQDWLSYRSKHIMATDSGTILGLNSWKDCHQLWQEKMGFVEIPPANEAMKRGSDLERYAREILNAQLCIDFEPVVIESSQFYWMGASLDGISQKYGSICEIKCMKLSKHLNFSRETLDPCHYAQMQHQMACSDIDLVYYVSYHPEADEKLKKIRIYRDEEYIENMIEKEKEFFFETMCNMQPTRDSWTLKQKVR